MSITFGDVKSFATGGRPTSLDFSNDGSLVAVGGYARGMTGGTLKILKTSDGSLVREYAHEAHGCLGVAFVTDSHDVAFLAQRHDGDVELWLTSEHQPRNLGPYSNPRATSLIRDRPGRLLGVVGTSVIVWDLVKGEVVANVLGAGNDLPLQAAFAEERPALIYIYGKQPGYIVKHDLRTGQDLASWAAPLGHESGTQVLPSPTGRYVTAIGYNASGHWIIDTTTGEKILTNYSPEDFDSRHFAFTVDEVALVTTATTARAYRLADRKLIKGPPVNAHRTWAASSCADGGWIGFATGDENALVWFEVTTTVDPEVLKTSDAVVSRRWLKFGPWELLERPDDVSTVFFHDPLAATVSTP